MIILELERNIPLLKPKTMWTAWWLNSSQVNFTTFFSNEMKINSLSPMFYSKLPLIKNKLSLTAGVGPTWLFYRNIGITIGDSVLLKGSSPGLSSSFRISYQVIPNLSIAIQGSYIYSLLKCFRQDNGTTKQEITPDKENFQNISRIYLSFGIFYTFRRK